MASNLKASRPLETCPSLTQLLSSHLQGAGAFVVLAEHLNSWLQGLQGVQLTGTSTERARTRALLRPRV